VDGANVNRAKQDRVYSFGPYRLNLDTRRLCKGNEEIKLRPKLFDLLTLLIESPGKMLEKEELIRRLWPDSVVEDSNLTVTVNALRAALRDGQYIETVSKRGYRFAAEVSVVPGELEVRVSDSSGQSLAEPPPGGALPLESPLYIARPADEEFRDAIARGDSIVLVKGARQVGKTSLLARGLQDARRRGALVILLDFQQFSSPALESANSLLLAAAEIIAEQLALEPASQIWKPFLGASSNFERFMKREVLEKTEAHIVWGLDEVDRLFRFDYASEIFGLFRSWHNLRALDPVGPWRRLTLAIAYATEAHLFITDLNQSPFNVGTRLSLSDFTLEQLTSLNRLHGEPLKTSEEVEQLLRLVGGHPYLSQRGLYELAHTQLDLGVIERQADRDDGPFADHLQRMLLSLQQDPVLLQQLRDFVLSNNVLSHQALSRLRSAGILSGDLTRPPELRCSVYARYLKEHLS